MTTWQSFRFFCGETWEFNVEFTEANGTPFEAARAMFEFYGPLHQAELRSDTPPEGVEANMVSAEGVRGARFVLTAPYTRTHVPGGLLHYRVWAYRSDGGASVQAEGLIRAVPPT